MTFPTINVLLSAIQGASSAYAPRDKKIRHIIGTWFLTHLRIKPTGMIFWVIWVRVIQKNPVHNPCIAIHNFLLTASFCIVLY